MKCSIGYSETKAMITYEDLQQEAKNAADKNFEYIKSLRQYFQLFFEKYLNSLEISSSSKFQDSNGNEEQIVTIGNVEDGRFVKRHLGEFKVNDNFELPIFVKTIIKVDSMQSTWAVVSVVIKESGGKVTFLIGNGEDATVCCIPSGHTLEVYGEAVDLLKEIIIKMVKRTAPQ
ncbi:TPA: hypothetical protein ACYR7K_003137 [Morganella morganii]